MDFKPQTFFIGVIDFFSVLLPGALLTYFLMGMFYGNIFGSEKIFSEPPNETVKWIVFLLITYILGNIIFMIGAFLDLTYDQFLRKRFFQSNNDLSYKTANAIHCKHIDTDKKLAELRAGKKISDEEYEEISDKKKREVFNTYKWAQHFLLFRNPEALADIKRIEADSKFFRSLVVAFLIIALLLLSRVNFAGFPRENLPVSEQAKIWEALLFIVLSALCYYRYGDLRRKSTERAYEMVITAHHLQPEEPVKEEKTEPKPNYSALKQDLTEDFLSRHGELISFLTKGFKNNLRLITVGEAKSYVFKADKKGSWYCLRGNGLLRVGDADEAVETRLIPNAIVSIGKGGNLSLINESKEPIEILVYET